jgi:MFS family permease
MKLAPDAPEGIWPMSETLVPDSSDLSVSLSHRRVLVVIGALMLGMFLAALDGTVVSTALPTIVGDLHGASHLTWVVTAYLLTSTVSTPLWGKLGDQFGRKFFFQAAIVIFLIGSALSGLRWSGPRPSWATSSPPASGGATRASSWACSG